MAKLVDVLIPIRKANLLETRKVSDLFTVVYKSIFELGANGIQDMVIKYDEFVAEENILIQRIGVCREFIEVILKYISEKADSIHILTAEDIVTAVHTMGQDLDTELLHIRLEKSLLEYKIKSLEANCDNTLCGKPLFI